MNDKKFQRGDLVSPTARASKNRMSATTKAIGIVIGYTDGGKYVDIMWLKNKHVEFKPAKGKSCAQSGQMDGGYNESDFKLIARNAWHTQIEDTLGSLYHTVNICTLIEALTA